MAQFLKYSQIFVGALRSFQREFTKVYKGVLERKLAIYEKNPGKYFEKLKATTENLVVCNLALESSDKDIVRSNEFYHYFDPALFFSSP